MSKVHKLPLLSNVINAPAFSQQQNVLGMLLTRQTVILNASKLISNEWQCNINISAVLILVNQACLNAKITKNKLSLNL